MGKYFEKSSRRPQTEGLKETQRSRSYFLGDLLRLSEESNRNSKYGIDSVKGVSIQKSFIETKADMAGVSLLPYSVVHPNYFSYVSVTSRNGGKISIAYNNTDESFIVSSSYIVFFVERTDVLLPEYIFLYFNRPEFDRYARFHSWGSAREVFSWDDMCEIEIDLPPVSVQQKYADVYSAITRNVGFRAKVKDICPILIRGAMEETEPKKILRGVQ